MEPTPNQQPNPNQPSLPEQQPVAPGAPEAAPPPPVGAPAGPPPPPATSPAGPPPANPAPPAANQSSTPAQPAVTGPNVAEDVDVIEKEWVDKAEHIIEKTKNDPHAEEEAVEALQVDYLKKRYGHNVKNTENK